jgi:hypothetical protein
VPQHRIGVAVDRKVTQRHHSHGVAFVVDNGQAARTQGNGG